MPPSDRPSEAWRALAPVTDPELDESIVELGFVARLQVTGGRVSVDFRLPTFWCAANFAAIMAEDIRDALASLAWVEASEVRLVEHFAEAEINRMIAEGQGFAEAFGEAGGTLSALRHTFRRKAYLGRMSALIEALRAAGETDPAIVALTVAQIAALASGANRQGIGPEGPAERAGGAGEQAGGDLDAPAAGEADTATLAARFVELRSAFGGPSGAHDTAFRLAEGEAITAASLPDALRAIRMTRRSAAANGEMCKALLAGRYGLEAATRDLRPPSAPPAPVPAKAWTR